MKSSTRAIAAAVAVAIAPRLLLAADAPAAPAPPVPGLSDLLTAWGLNVSGDIAASYYHSNGYPGSEWRGFDEDHDSLQLDEAGLQVAYQPKSGVGGFVDVITGTDAQILDENESLKVAPGGGTYSSSASAVDVRQAYLQYATGNLTVIAGKFVTLAGAEVINPTGNTNFSRSLLFWELEPLDHTGVRATYAATGTLTFSVGVNNGWNYTDLSTSGAKTGEFNATWTPNKVVSLAVTGYFGKDDVLFDGQQLSLIDFVGTYNVTSQLTLILNADFKQASGDGITGTDATQHWNGFAGYANYGFNDKWRVSIRGEYYNVVGAGHAFEGTGTVGYSPVKNLELRAELRYDKLSDGLATLGYDYVRTADPDGTPTSYAANNLEFALQGVYKFSLP
ncbi:MAG TPA: outer membrane beta-barrel protein [Steroidobacteraceae bacterium]|nr:outer membrane beta-barrel protein [Steroidobacteraceae bacterium]